MISTAIDGAMDALSGVAVVGCGAGLGPVAAVVCGGIVGGATGDLGYGLKYKFAGGSYSASGIRRATLNGPIDGGLTGGIARTAPEKAQHKANYTVQQKMWNVVAVLPKIPFIGSKLVSAARGALGWIFSMVEGAIQNLAG